MKKFQVKYVAVIFLSNLFLYLGLTFKPGPNLDSLKIMLPLTLNFKFINGEQLINVYDSFGELITDKVILIKGPKSDEGWFLTEMPIGEMEKLIILKTDKFLASPFNQRAFQRDNF